MTLFSVYCWRRHPHPRRVRQQDVPNRHRPFPDREPLLDVRHQLDPEVEPDNPGKTDNLNGGIRNSMTARLTFTVVEVE